MTEIVNRRRNIFINSEQYHNSNGDVKLMFPGNDFAVDKNERMRLSLEAFTMTRNFYNVNSNNNTFYVGNTTNGNVTVTKEVKITPGDYSSFTNLATAIETDLEGIYGNVDVTYDDVTRKLTIDMSSATGWTLQDAFVCFQVTDNSTIKPNVTSNGAFNDSCEILGGRPSKSFDTVIPAFTQSGTTYTAHYPAALKTIKAVHMKTNLQTHSYQTPNFNANSESSMLIPSDILAKIFTPSSHNDLVFSFKDSGSDAYSVDLQNKTLPDINIKLTDDKGRSLPAQPNQNADGNMSYLATLKWVAIASPMIGKETGMPRPDLQMKLYQ